MNIQTEGGIEPDAMVSVYDGRKSQSKRIADLQPGDLLEQVGSRFSYPVSEVRIFHRELSGQLLTLESGEKLLVANGTITCGQIGPNLVSDTPNEKLCFPILNDEEDKSSRRTFIAEFKGLPKPLRGMQPAKGLPRVMSKKFYRYSEMLASLEKYQRECPDLHIVPSLRISNHGKDGLYDFCRCVKETWPLLPLARVGGSDPAFSDDWPFFKLIAFCDSPRSVTSRKVVSTEEITSKGPWAMPLVDNGGYSATQLRYSFSANGVPVFMKSAFVDDWGIEATMANIGQDDLPSPPPKIDHSFWSLGAAYDEYLDAASPAKRAKHKQTLPALQKMAESMRELAGMNVPGKQILKYLKAQLKLPK